MKRDPVVIIVVAMVVTVMLVFGIQKVRRNPRTGCQCRAQHERPGGARLHFGVA